MIFDRLPPYLRLFLCLLLSTGAHGGVALYDGMTLPADSHLSAPPVTVTLLSAAESAPLALTVRAQQPQAPQPPQAVRPFKKATAKEPVKPVRPTPVATIPEPLPKNPLPEVVPDKPRTEPLPAEPVCMVPQTAVAAYAATPSAADPSPATSGVEAAEEMAVSSDDAAGAIDGATRAASAALIDAVPNYSSNPLPEYPALARQKHWQGVVWLLVDVSRQGKVADLRVEQSCGHSVLDRAATRTVRHWRFTPARRAGEPTASQVRIPIRFRLEDS